MCDPKLALMLASTVIPPILWGGGGGLTVVAIHYPLHNCLLQERNNNQHFQCTVPPLRLFAFRLYRGNNN